MAAILLNSPVFRRRFRRRRQQRDRPYPLDGLDNVDIVEKYRFDRESVDYLEALLHDDLQRATSRSNALSPMEILLMALRFYATGSMQLVVADTSAVSQPSVSRAIRQVTDALVRRAADFIIMPTTAAEINQAKRDFYGIAAFPGVVATIDGTHVKIKAPPDNEEVYVNRKGWHSLNIQVAMSAKGVIRDVVANWPGSTNDSRVLLNSGLCEKFNNGTFRGIILGDSGYALKRWMMTPILNPTTAAEEAYNRSHKTTRNTIERGFGVMKRRFACLHNEMRLTPGKTCKVVVACCILQNIAIDRNQPAPPPAPDAAAVPQPADNHDNHVAVPPNDRAAGIAARQHIIDNYFT